MAEAFIQPWMYIMDAWIMDVRSIRNEDSRIINVVVRMDMWKHTHLSSSVTFMTIFGSINCKIASIFHISFNFPIRQIAICEL